MRALAIDTTTRAGSIALIDDDRIVAERSGDESRSHAERLPADVVSLLTDHGVELGDIDLFAVASGPGSFTGLRVGIAAMQGFALVRRRPLVGVSALDALAHGAANGLARGARIAAWMDARRRDVFAALYEVAGDRALEEDFFVEIEGPMVGTPGSILARWRDVGRRPSVFAGDGAALYADAIAGEVHGARIVPPLALAGTIGRLAIRRARAGMTSSAAGVQPLYVRRPDAEIARDASLSATPGGQPRSRA